MGDIWPSWCEHCEKFGHDIKHCPTLDAERLADELVEEFRKSFDNAPTDTTKGGGEDE